MTRGVRGDERRAGLESDSFEKESYKKEGNDPRTNLVDYLSGEYEGLKQRIRQIDTTLNLVAKFAGDVVQ